MDILAYAAQKRAVDLCNCLCNCVAVNQAVYNNANNSAYNTTLNTSLIPYYCGCYNSYTCYQALGREALDKTPWCYCNWVSIPTLPGGNTSYAGPGVSGFQVCSTSVGNVGSGAGASGCTFTVPAGISYIRFQIWGAGGNAGSGQCCGGSGFGTTGAYASVIIPAITGCQYTLCAGSVATINPNRLSNYTNASCISNASSVNGFGLTNFCAMGGRGFAPSCIMANDISAGSAVSNCRWGSPDCIGGGNAGACICNAGNDYCFAFACATCGCIPFSKANQITYYGKNTFNINCCCSAINCSFPAFWWGQVVGINGMNGSTCYDAGFCGTHCHPPIYGFETVSQCVVISNGVGAGTAAGGLCCNGCAYNFMRYPGAGGTGVFLYGGCIATCDPANCASGCGGDIGRGGMVCVSYV